MPGQSPSRIIVDTNIWISFLIGRKLQNLKDLIIQEKVRLVISHQLLTEIRTVTSREKLKKYFNSQKVEELISLIELISEKIKINKVEKICCDPKDDFLLALAKLGKADYLIIGDKDLLDIGKFGVTKILTIQDFTKAMRLR